VVVAGEAMLDGDVPEDDAAESELPDNNDNKPPGDELAELFHAPLVSADVRSAKLLRLDC